MAGGGGPAPSHHSANLYEDLKTSGRRHAASVSTLRRWIGNEGLPSYQVTPGGKILVSCSEIDQFIASRRRPTPSLTKMIDEVMGKLTGPAKHQGEKQKR